MIQQTDLQPNPLVLVVDDDMAVRFLAHEALEPAGFRVIEAEDGNTALAVFTATHPDIVLLDVILPKLDGFATCASLRKQSGGKHVPIMMMTGLDDIASINRAYEVGATDFEVKPINWTILSHRIRYLLRANAAFAAVRINETRLADAQRIAQLGNWYWDIVQDQIRCSAECQRIFGLPPELTATHAVFLSCVHPADRLMVASVHNDALHLGKPYQLEYRIQQSNGVQRTVHEQAEITFDEAGRTLAIAATVQDITERKQAEEKIHYLAYYDFLTGLLNRQAFLQELERALESAQRQQQLAAILFIDLDNFKRINDTLGHSVGDNLLKAVAQRLQSNVRKIDYLARPKRGEQAESVGRLGGDEFILLLSDVQSVEDVATVTQRLQDILKNPVCMTDHEVVVTPSIGIAVFPYDGQDAESLLRNADIAMYQAKAAGKNTYKFYTESMNARALERLTLESKLRRALEQEELTLHYQPQLDLRKGTVVGVEALLRWYNPELGMVPPNEFIPLAEETGLIVPIGEWVLYTACAQSKAWQKAGFVPVRMAINLSSLQFRQYKLVESIEQVLAATGLESRYLELELTESMIMHHAEETIKILHRLKDMCLSLSVDDFGTGYSSLSYLKRFPLDTLKIDKSFIKDVPHNPDDAAITSAIIAMAHNLGLRVIAEGVETLQQLAFLKSHYCDGAQGYWFSKPVPAEQFARLLEGDFAEPPLI